MRRSRLGHHMPRNPRSLAQGRCGDAAPGAAAAPHPHQHAARNLDEVSAVAYQRSAMGESFPAELEGAREILETAPLAILAVDRAGRVSWANGRLDEMFGYLRGDVAGQPLEHLLPERLRA